MANSEFPILPTSKSDRVPGQRYIYNENIVIWDGRILKCEHGRERRKCKECGGTSICEHGRQRNHCKECGGSLICEHGRQRSLCKECGGASICEHGRVRSRCKECGGASICEHGRQRSRCKECGGSQICEHGRIRNQCRECGGSTFCEHGRRRNHCKECGGASICEHGRNRGQCKECGGASICEHGRQRRRCKECDLHGYIRHLISGRMRIAIINQNKIKDIGTLELLGCSINEVRVHLENQFIGEMSWENSGEWHIDHRRPCASFDLTNLDDQKICFHYSNLQPMWAAENMFKSDSFDEESFEWKWNGEEWIEK